MGIPTGDFVIWVLVLAYGWHILKNSITTGGIGQAKRLNLIQIGITSML
ncbi:hypothetical protein [Desulfosporosinus fructosivorans]|nr:hypothetical protein [Desulfosporosinus fructosivorans]